MEDDLDRMHIEPPQTLGDVLGPDAHALYRWIDDQAGEGAAPKWNFHKYLIGKDGSLQGAWPSRVKPMSEEITAAVEKAL